MKLVSTAILLHIRTKIRLHSPICSSKNQCSMPWDPQIDALLRTALATTARTLMLRELAEIAMLISTWIQFLLTKRAIDLLMLTFELVRELVVMLTHGLCPVT